MLILIDRFIENIPQVLAYSHYYTVTAHLMVSFHIIYASVNAVYSYQMENITDVFNTNFSISIAIFCFVVMSLTWYITYHSITPKLTVLELDVNTQYTISDK